MDEDKATRFVSSLVKSIQALCNGYIDFSTSIEVIGHIHLNIDRCVKLDYVLTEEVSKSISEGATVFASHSYHSQPPCSSKTSSDASEHPRQKSGHRGRDEADPLGFNSLSSEVPSSKSKTNSHSQNQSSSRFGESSDSSHSGNFSVSFDNDSIKQESDRTSQGQNSLDVRRRSALSQNAQSPAAKRSRSEDSGPKSTMMSSDSPEVIEIKEEPDDEPTVYFGDTSAHAGQDLQTPDFSNVVMESLDRVGQVEGAQLVTSGEGMPLQQHAPFPVMMHHGTSLSSSSASSSGGPLPGPSLSDPQASASTSGAGLGRSRKKSQTFLPELGLHCQGNVQPEGDTGFVGHFPRGYHYGGRVRNPRSAYWRNMSEERRALEREKSRLRMQISRARRKERENLFGLDKKTFYQGT